MKVVLTYSLCSFLALSCCATQELNVNLNAKQISPYPNQKTPPKRRQTDFLFSTTLSNPFY